MKTLPSLLLAIGCTSLTPSYASEIVWLSDNSGWERSAAALREKGLDVKNEAAIGSNSGLVVRVQGTLNDLTAPRGTPFGSYAVGVEVLYKCTVGALSLAINPISKVGNYSFTGQTASQEMRNIVASHIDVVLKAYQDANVPALAETCDGLRKMAESEKGAVKSGAKRK